MEGWMSMVIFSILVGGMIFHLGYLARKHRKQSKDVKDHTPD